MRSSFDRRGIEHATFLLLVVVITLGFAWILAPFYGAVLWGVIVAILFAPVNRRLRASMGGRRTLAAVATVAIIVLIVGLPLALLSGMMVQEATGIYDRIQSGNLDFARNFREAFAAMPPWMTHLLDRFGLTDFSAVEAQLSSSLTSAARFAAERAFRVGQNALEFVLGLLIMVYVLFFLLRDGERIAARVKAAIPLAAGQLRALSVKFTAVIRATVKGNIVVALVQGVLGGLMFWILGIPSAILWGALMAVASLLPAVGAAIVWLPVAIYLLAMGGTWQGIVLIVYGTIVIGLVDNLLRPILVGKDTRMPDTVVLVSTLGGISIFGFNGLVLGPVIAALFIATWDIFATARSEPRSDRTHED